jgi:hypothetical protein
LNKIGIEPHEIPEILFRKTHFIGFERKFYPFTVKEEDRGWFPSITPFHIIGAATYIEDLAEGTLVAVGQHVAANVQFKTVFVICGESAPDQIRLLDQADVKSACVGQ